MLGEGVSECYILMGCDDARLVYIAEEGGGFPSAETIRFLESQEVQQRYVREGRRWGLVETTWILSVFPGWWRLFGVFLSLEALEAR